MSSLQRNSYIFVAVVLVLIGVFHLVTPVLALLFSYFVLQKLRFITNKSLAVTFFLVVLVGILAVIYHYLVQGVLALPRIIQDTVPKIVNFAKEHNVDLPFEDVEGFRNLLLLGAKNEAQSISNLIRTGTKEVFFFVLGVAAAVSLYLNSKFDLGRESNTVKDNLYTRFSDQVVNRARTLFECFETVMGAQLLISAINTALTAVFILWSGLPYAGLLIVITFLAGLLPIIGNLISNTFIVAIALTLSSSHALGAVIFLVLLHKLEYFLNSKIIGDRIKNPMWMTLLSLIIAERLMGIPGMILAPVVLSYIKAETLKIRSTEKDEAIEKREPASAP